MFKKLINFATSIINPEPSSNAPNDSTPENNVPETSVPNDSVPKNTVPNDSAPENRVQENRVQENRVQENRVQENRVQENRVPGNRVPGNRVLEKELDTFEKALPEPFSKLIMPDTSSTRLKMPSPEALTNLEFSRQPKRTSPVRSGLASLYCSMSLEEGMVYLGRSISTFKPNEYISATQQWLQDSNFQTVGAMAISSKRQGDYAEAIAILNELATSCPHYYQIHHSVMKILAASDNIELALRAAKLLCIATIPEKALRLSPVQSQSITNDEAQTNATLHDLAGWAIAEQKTMYHLGSLHMIATQNLSPEATDAYVLKLQGKPQKELHHPKEAIQRGKEVAQSLPWHCLTPLMETAIWQYLRRLSSQKRQHLIQNRKAA